MPIFYFFVRCHTKLLAERQFHILVSVIQDNSNLVEGLVSLSVAAEGHCPAVAVDLTH